MDATTWRSTNADCKGFELVLAGIGETVNPTVHTDFASKPIVRGSTGDSSLTLWCLDGDYTSHLNGLAEWDINGGPLAWNTAPTFVGTASAYTSVADVSCDVDHGLDGKWFILVNRTSGTDVSSIKEYATDGTTLLWASFTAYGITAGNTAKPDPLLQSYASALSPDGNTYAILTITNDISFFTLTNGVIDQSSFLHYTNPASTSVTSPFLGNGRQICYDAAGNLYTVSSGQARLRVYAPGGTTVATTGLDGTFVVTNLVPVVTLAATQPYTSEDTNNFPPGDFTISRTGDTTLPLTVTYSITGTAINGVDYLTIINSATIPAAASSVDIYVWAIPDSIAEPTETVILTLSNSVNYIRGTTTPATVYISDTNTPVLSLAAISPSMYERVTNDYATVTIARNLGNTNLSLYFYDPGVFTFGGTAVMNVDYVVNSNLFLFSPFVINTGDRTDYVNLISPLNNNILDGSRTVIIGLQPSGTDYYGQPYTGATNLVTTTIIDDEYPPETVLWSDDFNVDSSANYTIQFGSGNGIPDYTATFAFDYSTYSIPPAPHSQGDTHGLLLNVNKLDPTALGAAGLNLYPVLNTSVYSTEMTQLDISGGTLPAGMQIRESPTKASLGTTTILPAPGGGYTISSFFDVYTELSTDGGATWYPDTNGPCHLVLRGPNTNWWADNALPPLDGWYTNDPPTWMGLFANGVVVSNANLSGFSASSPPPLPGVLQTDSFTSTADLQVSMDSGASFNEYTSDPGAVTFTITNSVPLLTSFSGNYALRFDMYLFCGSSATTEYSIFGINHDGAHVNWFRETAYGYTNSSYDGVWASVESDGSHSAPADYALLTSPTVTNRSGVFGPTSRATASSSSFTQVFKNPPFSSVYGGVPANTYGAPTPASPTWADVRTLSGGDPGDSAHQPQHDSPVQ